MVESELKLVFWDFRIMKVEEEETGTTFSVLHYTGGKKTRVNLPNEEYSAV